MCGEHFERLLFLQGNRCFFCGQPISRANANVEHLVAKSHGGGNNFENLVACCKATNSAFGSISLKEKIRIILQHEGRFKCLTTPCQPDVLDAKPRPKVKLSAKTKHSEVPDFLEKLKRIPLQARPKSINSLQSWLLTASGNRLSPEAMSKVIQGLHNAGFIDDVQGKLSYAGGK